MGLFDKLKRKKEPSKPIKTKSTTPREPANPLENKPVTLGEPSDPNLVETKTFETRTAYVKITKEKGKSPVKWIKKKEISPNELTELDLLKEKQANYYSVKLMDKNYYGGEESKIEARELNKELDSYLERNPKDYVTRGINLYNMLWEYSDTVPAEEKEIFELTGKGLYYEEDLKDYPKAIDFYQKGVNLTLEVMKEEIEELIREHGEKDYLYVAKLKQRIRACENTMFRVEVKKLEDEAKELEESNPIEAINKYGELNKVNPGLKKYNKAIAKIVEKMAKEKEETRNYKPLDLGHRNGEEKGTRAKEYEAGDIFNIYYSKDDLPSDEKLIEDYNLFLRMYEYLYEERGNTIFTDEELENNNITPTTIINLTEEEPQEQSTMSFQKYLDTYVENLIS